MKSETQHLSFEPFLTSSIDGTILNSAPQLQQSTGATRTVILTALIWPTISLYRLERYADQFCGLQTRMAAIGTVDWEFERLVCRRKWHYA